MFYLFELVVKAYIAVLRWAVRMTTAVNSLWAFSGMLLDDPFFFLSADSDKAM